MRKDAQKRFKNSQFLIVLTIFMLCGLGSSVQAQQNKKPSVVILATGGNMTHATGNNNGVDVTGSAKTPVENLVNNFKQLHGVAQVRGEQVFQVTSENFTNQHLLTLAKRVSALLKQPDIHGIVITQGTDTLEETAFFLNLVIRSEKPVVLSGSVRPNNGLSSDGTANLFQAVNIAANPSAKGRGVLVVISDQIFSARDVTKLVNIRTDAFNSQWGPLGMITRARIYWFRSSVKRHTSKSEFNIDEIKELPPVEIVYGYGSISIGAIKALGSSDIKALIHAGVGNGAISRHAASQLDQLRKKGIHIVRSSRLHDGLVIRNLEQNDDKLDWIAAHDFTPQKARILTAVALAKGLNTKNLQRVFWEY